MLYPNQDTQPSDLFGVPISEEDSWPNDNAASPLGGQPDNGAATTQPQEQPNNEDVRYQFWQSQHDKLKSQYDQLLRENEQLRIKGEPPINVPQAQPEPQEEAFPEPPAPPSKPYSFSQQEAMSDPSSESARYMMAMTEYNATMNQYNYLKNQWLEEKQKDYAKQSQQRYQMTEQEAVRKAEVSQQMNQVIAEVQQKYGVGYDVALDFVNTMSDNSSVTVDNLFELYKMKKGGAMQQQPRAANGRFAPQQPQYNFGAQMPSREFRQYQNAQSIPPTMGVHNAQAAQYEDPMVVAMRDAIVQANKSNVF